MGVTVKSVVFCTCDVCGVDWDNDDGLIEIEVNGGDRDVGPAKLRARLVFDQPYKCECGVVCKSCKFKWLEIYLSKHFIKPAKPGSAKGGDHD
jgi:hypothetical protein